ncbi:MAG: response regulator [Candidatus Lindowbacteria bacterium]|nr:response regulator [Candidatus Lindowbacteria bacterium]
MENKTNNSYLTPALPENDLSEDKAVGTVYAAKLLGVGKTTVQRWIDSNVIPSHRTMGGHRRVFISDVYSIANKMNLTVNRLVPKATPSLLIVDDEEPILENLSLFCRNACPNTMVLTANSGFQAGVLTNRFKPQLVMIDIRMPGMSGIEVCRSIKSEPETAQARIIGITAYRDTPEIQEIYDAGASGILYKPIDHSLLRNILEGSFPSIRTAVGQS